MKKRKQQKHIKDNNNSAQPIAEPQHRKIFSVLWKGFVVLAIVFGVVQGLAAFAPRMSVYNLSALDAANPFSTPFIVSNDGMLDIYSIEYSCVANFIETESHVVFKNSVASHWTPGRQILSPAEKDSFPCTFKDAAERTMGLSVLPMNTADVILDISFRPSFVAWRQTKSFRFITVRTKDNQLQWLPKSLK